LSALTARGPKIT